MEIQNLNQQTPFLDYSALQGKVDVSNSTLLKLKTKEGDLVTLTSSSRNSIEGKQGEAQSGNGEVVREISAAAQAASKYSISVQGQLNPDELDAIQQLVDRVSPLADQFFAGGQFDFQSSANALTGSLDQLQEVELQLEQTVEATFSGVRFQGNPPPPTPSQGQAGGTAQPGPIPASNIRDLAALVLSAVDSEFSRKAAELTGSNQTLKSLKDLMDLLRERLAETVQTNTPDNPNPSFEAVPDPASGESQTQPPQEV
ncbi:MAG: hypothetical protein COV67_00490 [Nitrospinae bacterium CG11_big_fil_rev_8_21_14_0_20_56_8]|nr:MAG: hypothetical protein COV67_00490 [Nitrospinae bacterium CG11_big_fil_rev_8_21_14_0_20_56_8]